MRYALFSDIHGNQIALKTALADYKHKNIDHYLCLGDICSDDCIDIVRQVAAKTVFGNWEVMAAGATTALISDKSNITDNHRWQLTLPPVLKFNTFWVAHADPIWNSSIDTLQTHLAQGGFDKLIADFPAHNTISTKLKRSFATLKKENIAIFFYGHIHQQKVWQCSEDGIIEALPPCSFTLQPSYTYMVSIGNIGSFSDEHEPTYAIFDTQTKHVELLQGKAID